MESWEDIKYISQVKTFYSRNGGRTFQMLQHNLPLCCGLHFVIAELSSAYHMLDVHERKKNGTLKEGVYTECCPHSY